MADQIETRLKENNFNHQFKNIQYDSSGHLISGNPDFKSELRTGILTVDNIQYS